MKIEAQQRIALTAGNGLRTMLGAFAAMSPAQQKTFVDGVFGMYHWYSGRFDSTKAKGTIKVATAVEAKSPTLELTLNAMVWLTKYCYPETVKGFSAAYRLHDAKYAKASGKKVRITPFKPILSWSATKSLRIATSMSARSYLILEISKPKVICSFKTIRALARDFEKSFDNEEDLLAEYLQKLGVAVTAAQDLATAIDMLIGEFRYAGETEKELVIYHGTTPFSATVTGYRE